MKRCRGLLTYRLGASVAASLRSRNGGDSVDSGLNDNIRGAGAATVGHSEAAGEQAGRAGSGRVVVAEVVGVARVDIGAANVDAEGADRVSVAEAAVDVDLAIASRPCGPRTDVDSLAQVIAARTDIERAIETAGHLSAGESLEPTPAVAARRAGAQGLELIRAARMMTERCAVVAVLDCRWARHSTASLGARRRTGPS